MMAANVAPSLVGSTIKDANGQSLPEADRARAEKLKMLRQEISQIENRLSAAQNMLDDKIAQLKRAAGSQQNVQVLPAFHDSLPAHPHDTSQNYRSFLYGPHVR